MRLAGGGRRTAEATNGGDGGGEEWRCGGDGGGAEAGSAAAAVAATQPVKSTGPAEESVGDAEAETLSETGAEAGVGASGVLSVMAVLTEWSCCG